MAAGVAKHVRAVANVAVWVIGGAVLALVAWGVFRAAPAPNVPLAPISIGGGTVVALLLPGRGLGATAVRLVAVLTALVSAILWTSA